MNSETKTSDIATRIQILLDSNDVVLFMKGDKEMPLCGFSAAVVKILNELGVVFVSVNVMKDETMRQGIKDYSDWPTLPQLYIKNEFIGGCDIVCDLLKSGELKILLQNKGIL